MIGQMEVSYENEEGDEITVSLPCKKVVCPFCHGEGAVLCEGMRGVAFTQEDMGEWDEEERREYLKHGLEKKSKTPKSCYDVTCEECDGNKVIDEVDETRLTEEEKVHFEAWQDSENNRADFDRAWASERNMERMMGCGLWQSPKRK